MLVRDAALGFDQSKRFAWVVGAEGAVSRRFVETGSLQGEMRVIESGLTLEDRIVVSGIQLLRNGMMVDPTDVAMFPGSDEGKEAEEEGPSGGTPNGNGGAPEPDAAGSPGEPGKNAGA